MPDSTPEGFREVRAPPAWGWVRPEAHSWWEESLSEAPTLYEAAELRLRRGGAEGPELRGRAPVFVLALEVATVAVRHYFRGGMVASLFGDRYLRTGSFRPITETLASEHLRSLGISTPRVLAATVYPSGPFYRGDLVTEFIQGGVDLGELLFGSWQRREGEGGPPHPLLPPTSATSFSRSASQSNSLPAEWEENTSLRLSALDRAVDLIDRLALAEMYHPDMNVKNFFVEVGTSPLKVHLLDLDRCRRERGAGAVARSSMIRRFRSSLEKWEKKVKKRLSKEEWERVGYISIS